MLPPKAATAEASDYAVKANRFLAVAKVLAREKGIDEAKVFNFG
jgi:hypothetical protein